MRRFKTGNFVKIAAPEPSNLTRELCHRARESQPVMPGSQFRFEQSTQSFQGLRRTAATYLTVSRLAQV